MIVSELSFPSRVRSALVSDESLRQSVPWSTHSGKAAQCRVNPFGRFPPLFNVSVEKKSRNARTSSKLADAPNSLALVSLLFPHLYLHHQENSHNVSPLLSSVDVVLEPDRSLRRCSFPTCPHLTGLNLLLPPTTTNPPVARPSRPPRRRPTRRRRRPSRPKRLRPRLPLNRPCNRRTLNTRPRPPRPRRRLLPLLPERPTRRPSRRRLEQPRTRLRLPLARALRRDLLPRLNTLPRCTRTSSCPSSETMPFYRRRNQTKLTRCLLFRILSGKAGLGPHYNDGSGFADQVKAKGEILKGKVRNLIFFHSAHGSRSAPETDDPRSTTPLKKRVYSSRTTPNSSSKVTRGNRDSSRRKLARPTSTTTTTRRSPAPTTATPPRSPRTPRPRTSRTRVARPRRPRRLRAPSRTEKRFPFSPRTRKDVQNISLS